MLPLTCVRELGCILILWAWGRIAPSAEKFWEWLIFRVAKGPNWLAREASDRDHVFLLCLFSPANVAKR